jgi:hypothetical protein
MARTRERMKGRRERGTFSMLVHNYFTSPEYAALSPRGLKVLIDLLTQYRGSNNGDLCAAWQIMSKLGWNSRDQLYKGIQELKDKGWIVVARQGWNRAPTLYALTFLAIDECGGKLDIASTRTPLHLWKCGVATEKTASRTTGRCVPHGGLKLTQTAEL